MLKFDIIEPKEGNHKSKYIKKIEHHMIFLKEDSIDVSELKNVNYILVEELLEGREAEFIGSVLLLKKELYKIQEDVRELVGALPLQGFVWECSFSYFSKNRDQETKTSVISAQEFYWGLYNKLVEFGKRKEIGFIIMKLLPETYLSSKEWGEWPYVVELKPENSPDKLFHGILPLTGSQYEAYKRSWKI
ncbi:MAG: hypothetical protein K2Y08_00840 [Alphaproteobacteria bacterium]|nr:hypothetical protein [Alphaproteobacteria bacterium]